MPHDDDEAREPRPTRRWTRREMLRGGAGASLTLLVAPALTRQAATERRLWAFDEVGFARVRIEDSFWSPKQRRVALKALPACIEQTEAKTGRIRNFEKAASRQGRHEGIYFDDSDVYKAIEAIAYSIATRPDAALEAKADAWIDKIVAAQLPDGYLNTYFTLEGLDRRWTDMEKHEDYCAGHLIEAAVAYFEATGKRKLLDAATRLADHIDRTFRLADRHWVSGHEEIELALMRLYKLSGDERYVALAQWYLEQRGHGFGRGALWQPGADLNYCQDAQPVRAQRQIAGHAVRAMYLYSAITDVGAQRADAGYLDTARAVWDDVVARKMYVTGGIGSAGFDEGFTRDYDLPNLQAYCETCASVGMVFFNHRLNRLTGEAQYADVMERALYNGALDGIGLAGDRFFYANPLATDTSLPAGPFGYGRQAWFGTACCPANICRLLGSLGNYAYGVSPDALWVNLYVAGRADLELGGARVGLTVATGYPWEGRVLLAVNSATPHRFALRLRIPGWARGEPVPGGLYTDAATVPAANEVRLRVNEAAQALRMDRGYAVIERVWRRGDRVELVLPMVPRRLVARPEVTADAGRTAVQRGPLVYCVESGDNGGDCWNLTVSAESPLRETRMQILDEPIVALETDGRAAVALNGGQDVGARDATVTLVPYYAWANRDSRQMQVWLPTRFSSLKQSA